MTIGELYQGLVDTGLPVTYYDWSGAEEVPEPPYIAYLFAYDSDYKADNINYVEISNFQVELYTDKKDLASEKLLQDKLKEMELPYTKTETKLETENMYQIVYEIQLI